MYHYRGGKITMENFVTVSNTNSKLGAQIYSINLPVGITCRPDAPCFKDCYARRGHWMYDGLYVPDFLVVSRTAEGAIDRICIIETKGEGYAPKFKERLEFMRDVFVPKNNEQYKRDRFRFLYLEDTDGHEERIKKTIQMINEFFK